MAMEGKEVARMYRRILKLAQNYPSVKRNAIIRDIKLEFHQNKHLVDDNVINKKIAEARAGIKELSMYAGLNPSAMNWAVEVGRDVDHTPPPQSASVNVKRVGEKE